VVSTIYQVNNKFGRALQLIPVAGRFFNGIDKLVWQGIFHGKLEDKTHAIQIFNQHIEEVKRTVPSEQLLIFEARQGWEPLCKFLNVPIPANRPYPHVNDSARVKRMLKFAPVIIAGTLTTITILVVMFVRTLLSG
jgi:hypothetical protein